MVMASNPRSVWRPMGRLGPVELADQLEGVAYLRSLPEVNGKRIGIAGSSYGGLP